jgi:hypothetical protein
LSALELGGEDLGLLGRELLFGEDALSLQVGELLQLRRYVHCGASVRDLTDARRFVRSQFLELDGGDVSVPVLVDEHEVDDPDRSVVDELAERRDDLAP